MKVACPLQWYAMPEFTNMWTPPIHWEQSKNVSKKFKGKFEKGYKKDDTNKRTFTIPLNKEKPEDNSLERTLLVFSKEGTCEEYCKWRISVEDLIGCMPDMTPEKRFSIYKSLVEGKLHDTFAKAHEEATKKLRHHLVEDRIKALNFALNEVALTIFPEGEGSARLQKRYMRTNLHMQQPPKDWFERLDKMNGYFRYYPWEAGKPYRQVKALQWDELVDIADRVKPVEMHIVMLQQGKKPHLFTSLEEAKETFECLHEAAELQKKLQEHKDKEQADRKPSAKPLSRKEKKRDRESRDNNSNPSSGDGKGQRPFKACANCGKFHKGKCWHQDKGGSNKRGRFNQCSFG